MKISLKWLKRYIDLDYPIEKISEILTDIGLEVEGLEEVESIKGGLKGIVVGYVTSKAGHPDADRLSVTTVNVGGEEDLNIVCGAPNVAQGQKVLVATIGTTLYDKEGEPWKIKKSKIRGALSEGMICAEDELGLGQGHDGIMVLPEDIPVGTLASKYFKVESDFVFEIGLTPNRSDATNHYGVAKDLAAYLKINEGHSGKVKNVEPLAFDIEQKTRTFKIDILNEDACKRYSGITLSNIEVKESPDWLKSLLNSIGVRPINNIVDITNFILHDLGQPLHAFDADTVKNDHIIVDTLSTGSSFTTLDEKERKMDEHDLMICDGDKNPMCIAGVFGGINSGVTEETNHIFLESAHFDASWIRKTSTRHLLRTDAAKIFEKGSDPNITVVALKRAANMIKELAGGVITSELNDVYPKKIDRKEIQLSYKNVNTSIGTVITKDEVEQILQAMDMEVKVGNDDTLMVKVPTNKADVIREADLIEEILRIYGFNKVPIPTQIKSTLNFSDYPNKNLILNQIAELLANNGFNEMMNLSLIESKYYKEVLPIDESKLVFINNTSNIHLDIMRPEALLPILESVVRNQNHQQSDLMLFESGRTYTKSGDDSFEEREFISFVINGSKELESWARKDGSAVDFFNLKKWVDQICSHLNIAKYRTSEEEGDARFDYALTFKKGKNPFVKLGAVKSSILKKMDIKSDVFYAEFDVKELVAACLQAKTKISNISKYPTTRRDLALVCDKSIKYDQIKKITNQIGAKNLKEMDLFDIYQDEEKLGKGKKSYAVKFIFEDHEKTLNDKEVDKVMQDLAQKFEKELGAFIRQ